MNRYLSSTQSILERKLGLKDPNHPTHIIDQNAVGTSFPKKSKSDPIVRMAKSVTVEESLQMLEFSYNKAPSFSWEWFSAGDFCWGKLRVTKGRQPRKKKTRGNSNKKNTWVGIFFTFPVYFPEKYNNFLKKVFSKATVGWGPTHPTTLTSIKASKPIF